MMQPLLEDTPSVKQHNVSPVTGDDVDFLWDGYIWPTFRKIPGFLMLYEEAYTFQQVKMGHWQVWAYSDTEIRGMVLTRINVFPLCKVFEVMGIGGEAGLEFMSDIDDVFEVLARQQDCAYLCAEARPGMERIISRKHQGYRISSTMVRSVRHRRIADG